MLAVISGASTWWADMPAAFSATISLFWFIVISVKMVPSSTENGRKRAMICGTRSDIYCQTCASVFPGTARIFPDSPSRSSACRTSTSPARMPNVRTRNILPM